MFPKSLDPLYVARTLTSGAAAATVFGPLWVVQGINALRAPAPIALPLVALLALLTLSMVVACLRLFSTARLFSPSGDAPAMKQAGRYITIATVIQVVVSVIGPLVLTLCGRASLALPAIIVSVGLFMLALAPLLRLPHYALVGGFLTVFPMLSIFCMPETILAAGGELQSWTVINGIVCGLVNLGSGWTNIVLTGRMRRTQNRQAHAFAVQRSSSGLLHG